MLSLPRASAAPRGMRGAPWQGCMCAYMQVLCKALRVDKVGQACELEGASECERMCVHVSPAL